MGIFIKSGILHTLKFHLHTLSCDFWLNLWAIVPRYRYRYLRVGQVQIQVQVHCFSKVPRYRYRYSWKVPRYRYKYFVWWCHKKSDMFSDTNSMCVPFILYIYLKISYKLECKKVTFAQPLQNTVFLCSLIYSNQCKLMITCIWVNIGSGNGLVIFIFFSLSEPMLTFDWSLVRSVDIHRRSISWDTLSISHYL